MMVTTYNTTRYTPMRVYADATTAKQGQPENGISAIGYIVTNHNGRMLGRNGRRIGKGYDSYTAELIALEDGLDALAESDGVEHVNAYTDCKWMLDEHGDELRSRYGDIFEYVTIEWVPRSCNTQAHAQAEIHADREKGVRLGEPAQTTKYGVMD